MLAERFRRRWAIGASARSGLRHGTSFASDSGGSTTASRFVNHADDVRPQSATLAAIDGPSLPGDKA
jgi:hypothetical protein